MKNVTAYYLPADSARMIFLYDSDAADIVLSDFMKWVERGDSDCYAGYRAIAGSFTGKTNKLGGIDGVFSWRGRSFVVVDSVLITPPPDESVFEDETYR